MKPGVYIHIPFCKSRCSYCDFATDIYRSASAVERYVDALVREIKDFNADAPRKIDSLYFGGGTPSLLTPAQLERIVAAVNEKFGVSADLEFTLEMNPATVDTEKLREFRAIGVNRASFGVQTFNNRDLKLLARGHDATDARLTYIHLREAGFDNVSFDLIAGLPGQSIDDWTANLEEAVALAPEHLSLYLLEIHEGTPLAEQIRSNRRQMIDDEVAAEMYELMIDITAANGLEQYEISNFARPGRESRHNSKYWELAPVYGFGVSAHSFDGVSRYANERDTNSYVTMIEAGLSPVVTRDELTEKQLSAEFAFLNLRLTKGIDLLDYSNRFNIDLRTEYAEQFADLKNSGLIELSGDRLKLTRKGMLYSNEVFSLFV